MQFESVDLEVARGLRAIGAGRIQAFQHGLWPNTRPLVWSYSLWMLEYNIRPASIVGYVGAGGVGVLLHVYQDITSGIASPLCSSSSLPWLLCLIKQANG
jgi:ABC-type phosphate/phosphonate transport system permease subunit